jgi:uncharacterized FlaG/YvyC family protein
MQVNSATTFSEYNPAVSQTLETTKETAKVEKPNPEKDEAKIANSENLEQLKSVLAENKITLQFSQDTETKQLVVKLVDDVTGEAIRQIPTEISLKLSAVFVKMKGQFVDTKE